MIAVCPSRPIFSTVCDTMGCLLSQQHGVAGCLSRLMMLGEITSNRFHCRDLSGGGLDESERGAM